MAKYYQLLVLATTALLTAAVPGCAQEAKPAQKAASIQGAPPTTAHINELGLENGAIARAVGLWDVTETVWEKPGAAPVVTKDLVAERRMVGSMLEETLRSPSDPARPLRVDYLSFNRVEGRWEYVSMDTRAAVGIMTAQSYDRGQPGKIAIIFQPFAVPGPGPELAGQMLRMRQDIVTEGPGRDVKNQYFLMADGNGAEWLAHQYAYVRRN